MTETADQNRLNLFEDRYRAVSGGSVSSASDVNLGAQRPMLLVLPTPDAIGEHIAERLLDRLETARAAGRRFLLGCPTGRTPRPIFAALARRVAESRPDLSHLVLVMMDEYLMPNRGALEYAPSTAPWSCHYFARVEIAEPMNTRLPSSRRLPEASIWFPEPSNPSGYEQRIVDAGGIDFFMLASGASDGHVAFNQPESERDSRTRIIPLSDQTRRDNLQTFPAFGSLENVPRHGVSVGVATIAESREAAMIVWGAGKGVTLARMLAADRYQPDWPATLIHECSASEIVCDTAAQDSARFA